MTQQKLNSIPEWFYRQWRDFSFRANRFFGVWEETQERRHYAGTVDHWMLLAVFKGEILIRKGLRECRLTEHQLLLLHPSSEGYEQVNLYPGNQVCRFPIVLLTPNEPVSPLGTLPNLCPVPYPDPQRMDYLLEKIADMTGKDRSDADVLKGTAFLHELLTTYVLTGFQQGHFSPDTHHIPSWVDDARAYIDEHHKEAQLLLEDVARKVGRAPRTLQLGFKKAFGLSPMTYLHQKRILTAKRLIASNPEFTIQYLMSLCGYNNRSQFHRMFVKHVGKSPSAFRTKTE